MSTRDELAGVLADTINKQFKDMKVAYFLDGTDTTPTDIKDFNCGLFASIIFKYP